MTFHFTHRQLAMLWSVWVTGAILFAVSLLAWRTVNIDYHLYSALASYAGGWDVTWHYAVYTWAYAVVDVFRWLTVPFLVVVSVVQIVHAARGTAKETI